MRWAKLIFAKAGRRPAAVAQASCPCRRGAAMIETVVMLVLLLTLFFGMLDLGLAVLRRNLVAQVAREVARTASVHGELAEAYVSRWGPTAITVQADATGEVDGEIAAAARRHLGVLDPQKTTITITWPDGNDEPESRVRVVVTGKHQPFMTALFGAGEMTFRAETTVQVNH